MTIIFAVLIILAIVFLVFGIINNSARYVGIGGLCLAIIEFIGTANHTIK